MIATHHIKVNGRWYSAGEEVPEETVQEEIPVQVQEQETAEAAPKKTTTSRRKATK